jgi:hypothetical protein
MRYGTVLTNSQARLLVYKFWFRQSEKIKMMILLIFLVNTYLAVHVFVVQTHAHTQRTFLVVGRLTTSTNMRSKVEGMIVPIGLNRSPPEIERPWYRAMEVAKNRWVLKTMAKAVRGRPFMKTWNLMPSFLDAVSI